MTHNHLVSSDKPCATTVVSSLARVAFLEVTSASQACMKKSIPVTIPQTWHIVENNFIMHERKIQRSIAAQLKYLPKQIPEF